MKKIGLIGTANSQEAIEYYNYISQAMSVSNSEYVQNNVFIYSIKLFTDEEEGINAMKLWKVVFNMMSNQVKSIVLCNHTLEHLNKYINPEVMGGLPIIQSGIIVADEIKRMKCSKLVIFTTHVTEELHYFLTSLKNSGIELRLLHESNRKKIEELILNHSTSQTLPSATQDLLNSWFKELPNYGIDGILVDTPLLFHFLQQLSLDLPIFYSRKVHAEAAVSFILS